MANSMFDILMEIRQVDKQISEQNLIYQKSQEEIFSLEKEIHNVKDLQSKALVILEDAKRKHENTLAELKSIHDKSDSLYEYLKEYAETTPQYDIDQLKKRRDELLGKLEKARAEMNSTAARLNDIDIEITIEKKKQAAMTLRLKKTLQECLQEEKKLTDQLRFM